MYHINFDLEKVIEKITNEIEETPSSYKTGYRNFVCDKKWCCLGNKYTKALNYFELEYINTHNLQPIIGLVLTAHYGQIWRFSSCVLGWTVWKIV